MSIYALSLSFLILALALVQSSLSDSQSVLDSQPSSVEAGFENLWFASFLSSPFFTLAVLFVLFDIELILLLPCFAWSENYLSSSYLHSLFVVVILTLFLEWIFTGLNWQLQ